MKNIIKNKKYEMFCLIISLIVFGICFYRACTTSITYDEAFTYMNYVLDNPFLVFKSLLVKGAWANNHILNSFLISVIQFFIHKEYCEILIRIPNLLSYILYLVFSYKLCSKYKGKYAYFCILTLNYGINEFFGLARGYGMCSSFVLVGIYYFREYLNDKKSLKKLLLSYLFLMLSCYANTVSLIVFATILLVSFFILLKDKNILELIKKYFWVLIPIGIFSLLIVRYHFMVSAEGLPLYGGTGTFYDDVIVSIYSYYGFNQYAKDISLLLLGFMIATIMINVKSVIKNPLIISSIMYFVLLIFLVKITNSMWLTGRCLLPTWPLVFISFAEILEMYSKNKLKFRLINIFIIMICFINFGYNCNIKSTRDWLDNYEIKDKAYEAFKTKNKSLMDPYILNETTNFYRNKIINAYNYDILLKD